MLHQATEGLLATLCDEKSDERAIQRAAGAWVKTLHNLSVFSGRDTESQSL